MHHRRPAAGQHRQGIREARGEPALARAARPVDRYQPGPPQPRRAREHPTSQFGVRLDNCDGRPASFRVQRGLAWHSLG
ncbi:hypothetical protein GCM10028790_50970 [Micromonospora taraxaci]